MPAGVVGLPCGVDPCPSVVGDIHSRKVQSGAAGAQVPQQGHCPSTRLHGQEVHLDTSSIDRKSPGLDAGLEDGTALRTVVLLPWKKSRLSGLDVFRTILSVLKFLDPDSGL